MRSKSRTHGVNPASIRTIRITVLLGVLLAWETAASFAGSRRTYIPHIRDVAAAAAGFLSDEDFGSNALATLTAVASGVAIGGIIGVTAGLLITSSSRVRLVVEPIILYLGAIPKIVLYPLFIYTLSVGMGSRIGMATLSVMFPVAVSTIGSGWLIRPLWLGAARMLGATRLQGIRYVALPAMLPGILTGLQLGSAAGIVGTVAAESKIGNEGIGYLLVDHYSRLEIPEMFALVLIVFMCASLLAMVLERAQRGLRRSQERQNLQPPPF